MGIPTWESHGNPVRILWESYGNPVGILESYVNSHMGILWESCVNPIGDLIRYTFDFECFTMMLLIFTHFYATTI